MKHGESPGMGKSSSRDWMGVGQWEHLLGHEYQCKRRQDNDGITDGSTDHSGLGFGIVAVGRDVTFCSAVMNVKHGARACPGDTDTHLTAYRSRYVQLGFAIATSESGPAYTWLASTFAPLFQALVSCLDAAMAW